MTVGEVVIAGETEKERGREAFIFLKNSKPSSLAPPI